VVLSEYLCDVIISDKLLLVKLSEHPFSECLLNCVEIYLREPGEYIIFPEAVSEESMKVRMRYLQPCTWLRQDAAPGRGWLKPPQRFAQ
jgi:hypothetical protein